MTWGYCLSAQADPPLAEALSRPELKLGSYIETSMCRRTNGRGGDVPDWRLRQVGNS